ncbi:hypothetical protein BFF94_036235 [Burkholderia catarinensis]|nr:hypothetical protein BFF94_036235 [Burkholderia catarinensis]
MVIHAASSHAAPLPLEMLLRGVDADPAVQAEYANLDAVRSDYSSRVSEKGWQVFAGGGIGDYHELVVGDQVANYYGRNLAVGVRYPLLGSLKRQADAVSASGFAIERQQLQLVLLRAEFQLTLRNAYADWWRAQQQQAVCVPLLAVADEALGQLQRRKQAGWLLTADASQAHNDWRAVLKPCTTTADADSYRSQLALLTQMPLPADAIAVDEPLALSPAPFPEWQAAIDQNPRVASAAAHVDETRGGRDERWYDNIESNISLGYYLSERAGVPYLGHSLVIGINFSMPFDVAGVTRSHRDASKARHMAALNRVEAERRNLLVQLRQALRAHDAAVLNAQQSNSRFSTAVERVRERSVRLGLDADAAVLQRQAAQREFYQAAFARIDAWHDWWLQDAALHLLSDGTPEIGVLLGNRTWRWQAQPDALALQAAPADVPIPSTWGQGTYIWSSDVLLDPARRSGEFAALRAAGIQRLYVGLTAAQLKDLVATKAALRTLLKMARAQGMRVDLLLGDPDWLNPAHRDELIGVLRRLRDVPFAGVNLDLEVEQLGTPVPDSRLKDWIDTTAAAAAASAWPVSLSSHYRWFLAPAADRICVPCALAGLGVRDVNLMIYTRNPQRSTMLASDIAQRWPNLRFRVVQSVESQLSVLESWWGVPHSQLNEQILRWQHTLAPFGVTGIDWQDWREFPRQSNGTERP